jgi:hypothetical protein
MEQDYTQRLVPIERSPMMPMVVDGAPRCPSFWLTWEAVFSNPIRQVGEYFNDGWCPTFAPLLG